VGAAEESRAGLVGGPRVGHTEVTLFQSATPETPTTGKSTMPDATTDVDFTQQFKRLRRQVRWLWVSVLVTLLLSALCALALFNWSLARWDNEAKINRAVHTRLEKLEDQR